MSRPQRQRVCVLGSTGSVGANTLDVISRHPGRYEVFALSAHSQVDALLQQCLQWQPQFAALPDAARARDLQARLAGHGLPTHVLSGTAALEEDVRT